MAQRCPQAKLIGTAMLKNWRLIFKNHATVELTCPDDGCYVPVLVWGLTPECERALDVYEGYRPDSGWLSGLGYYRKEYVKISIDGFVDEDGNKISRHLRKAMLYVMNPRPLALPSKHYFDVIAEGYKDFGFDMNVLRNALEDSRREA